MTNRFEKEILDLLSEGKEKYGFIALRGEYEAEGSSDEDIARLSAIANKMGLSLCIKIGGCEAIRDLRKAKKFGADMVLAPMIESSYALKKYKDSIKQVFEEQELFEKKFLFNIETITGFKNIDLIINEAKNFICPLSIVLGRVDFVQSLDLGREEIETEKVFEYCKKLANICLREKFSFSMGGGVSIDSIENLNCLANISLNNFETRKIVFDISTLKKNCSDKAIFLANQFELLWLKSKEVISPQEHLRISLLEKRASN